MKSIRGIGFLSSFIFALLLVGAARGASFTVNTTGDASDAAAGDGLCADSGGNCTLRAAVEEANALVGNDVVNFAASLTGSTITLTSGVEISVSSLGGNLQISGPGADKLRIDGGAGSNRVLNIGIPSPNNITVTITGVTLQGGGNAGVGGDGGAIQINGGTLVMNAILVRNNYGGFGGGLAISNTACSILNSTFSNNSAFTGGGLLQTNGTLSVANTTFSGNFLIGNGQGGGINLNSVTATFRNSTITNNTAGCCGGGVQVAGGSSFSFGNTIIAGNNAGGGNPEMLNFTAVTSAGNNFVGDSAGDSTSTNVPVTYQMSDIRDQNPMLGMLQNNGGSTPTHALIAGSAAINAGDNAKAVNPYDNSLLTSDQRGFAPRSMGGAVDIGAFEFSAAPTAASVAVGGRVFSAKGVGLSNARVTLTNAHGQLRTMLTNPFGYYRFDEVAAGETYIFTAAHKRYSFTPQVVSVAEELTEFNFTAEP